MKWAWLKRNERMWRGEYPIAGLLLALAFIFLWRVTFGGQALLPSDNLFSFPPWNAYSQEYNVKLPHNELMGDMILQNYSWKTFAKESLKGGQLPLWNPYIFSGMPFLAAGQYAVLYPLGFFFYLMPVLYAYGWFTALHLFLGGLFMYFFMRTIGVGRLGALLSGIAFMFSGFLVVSFQWPMMVSTAVWLPFILACGERVIKAMEAPSEKGWVSAGLLWALVGALALGLQFLAGHMEISFYILFTLLFYSAARLGIILWEKRRAGRVLGTIGTLVLMVGLGTGLAAVQLVPFYELIKENYRAGSATYQEVAGWALPKRQALALLMPDFFGNPTHHSYFDVVSGRVEPVAGAKDSAGQPESYPFWGIKNYVEGTGYVGILPILLALSAFFVRPNKYTWIFGAYALFSLLLAFGSPLYAFFFYGIPGINQLHSPFRWVFPYSFSVIVLAGIGAHALWEDKEGRKGPFLLRVAATVGGVVILIALVGSRLLLPFTLSLVQEALHRSSALSLAFPYPQMLYSYQFRNFLVLALLLLAGGTLLIRLGSPSGKKGYLLAFLLLGLMVADLFQFGYGYYSSTDPRLLEFTPKALAFLKEDPDLFRIATFGQKDILKPNSGMMVGLQDIRGYDTIIPRRYVEFWRLMEEPSGLLYSQINRLAQVRSLESPLLSLMNVKYILSAEETNVPGYSLAYRGEMNIYRNENALPRAFAVFNTVRPKTKDEALAALSEPSFNPRRAVVLEGAGPSATSAPSGPSFQPARVLTYGPNKVVAEIDMPQEGYLILSDFYFPGWRARNERGEELPILRANYIFRAVFLPQGRHMVTFAYSPDTFRLGLLISFMAAATMALGAAYWGWQRMYQGAGETSTVRRVVKNSLTPMAAQILSRMVDLGFAIFMLRILGPANYGNYAFAVVIIGYFSIFTDFGLGTLLTREVAKGPSLANRYLSNTLLIRLGLCILSAPFLLALLGLYYGRFGLSSEAVIVGLLFMVGLFPSSAAGAISSIFVAHEKMEYPAAVMVITTLLRTALGIGALLLGWGIIGLGVVSVLTSTVNAMIFYLILTRTFFTPKVEVDLAFSRELGGASGPLMVNNLLSTIFFRIDIMLLQPMRGHQAVGYYSTAYKFVDGLNIIPSFFTLALFPIMSRYAEASREALVRAYCRAIKALLIVAMPITVGTTIIASQLVTLFFGQDYAPSARALQILIWFLPFSYINSVTQYVLIAVNQQRFLTFAFAIGTIFNILANLVVIPYFGLEGAAAVTILSEMVLMIPFFAAVRRHVGEVPLLGLGFRPALASFFMGAIVLSLQHLPLLVIIPLGFLVYGAALILLQTFDDDDKAMVRALLARP